jgi:molybdopterin-guanine dinucleotide biosynthesis protein A
MYQEENKYVEEIENNAADVEILKEKINEVENIITQNEHEHQKQVKNLTNIFKRMQDNTKHILKSISKLQNRMINDNYLLCAGNATAFIDQTFKRFNHALDEIDASISAIGREHKTIELTYEGTPVDIDKKIAPLIEEIWKAGISTANSCENNNPINYIWIEFDTSIGCENFLNICFKNIDKNNDIFIRAMCKHEWDKNAWIYSTCVDCYNSDSDIIKNTIMGTSVRFPKQDYQFIYDKFVEHNKSNNVSN